MNLAFKQQILCISHIRRQSVIQDSAIERIPNSILEPPISNLTCLGALFSVTLRPSLRGRVLSKMVLSMMVQFILPCLYWSLMPSRQRRVSVINIVSILFSFSETHIIIQQVKLSHVFIFTVTTNQILFHSFIDLLK